MFCKRFIVSLCLLAFALPLARAQDGHDLWEVDYDKALELAAKSGKDLLVDFSGSDWCGWCQKLDKEVFSQDLFKENAPKDYILVVLDFPRDEALKAKIKNSERNQALVKQFNVRGYPTVLLMDSTGTPYAQKGYQQGGPEAYLKHLTELKNSPVGEKINKMAAKLASARTDDAKSAALQEILTYDKEIKEDRENARYFGINFQQFQGVVEESFSWKTADNGDMKLMAVDFLLERGVTGPKLHQAIKELDPNNDKGYLEKFMMAELNGKMSSKDWKGAIAFVESFVGSFNFSEGDNDTVARYYAGYAANQLGDKEKARLFYKEALASNPADPRLKTAIERNLQALDKDQ